MGNRLNASSEQKRNKKRITWRQSETRLTAYRQDMQGEEQGEHGQEETSQKQVRETLDEQYGLDKHQTKE